ncbi:hypothetical protein B0H19DRAFT_1252220 [Mycena capillaripes]|nr:hypothetical protein B0H19DRAFT_1252220 [Mycena capillaripes]
MLEQWCSRWLFSLLQLLLASRRRNNQMKLSLASVFLAVAVAVSGVPADPPVDTTTATTTISTPTAWSPTGVPSDGKTQHWGQCGGIGFTGVTVCEPPFVCTVENDYVSGRF